MDGISETASMIRLYPNPAQNGYTTLEFTALTNETMQIRIYGADGKLHESKTFDAVTGDNKCVLNLQQYSGGVYWIEISTQTAVHRMQLLK